MIYYRDAGDAPLSHPGSNDTRQGSAKLPSIIEHSLFVIFFRSYDLNITLGLQLDTDLLNLLLNPHLLV